MTNQVLVELSYNKKVLIDVAHLPQLMSILEGASIVGYDYYGDKRVDYVEDKGYHVEFGQTSGNTFVTEDIYREEKQAHDEAMAQQEAEEAA
jgi:hypothetical protein